MPKVILHCDLNCFFASVEMKYHPELRNVPMAIAGDVNQRNGIILAKNPLARAKGIQTTDPIFKAKNKCPNLIIRKPNYELYEKHSKMVHELYLQYTDKVEPFGIDECWLDISDSIKYFGSTNNIVKDLLRRVKEEIGLTLSIGVSFNKIYAKLGSDIATEDSYVYINSLNDIKDLPANMLVGIGNKTYEHLQTNNIYTINDLALCSKEFLLNNYGKQGEYLNLIARGLGYDNVSNYYKEKEKNKSISNCITPPNDINDLETVNILFKKISENIASNLRSQNLYFRTISITCKNTKLDCVSFQKKLDENYNTSNIIHNEALKLFKENITLANPLRMVGISVTELSDKKIGRSLSLFTDNKFDDKQEKLEKTIDYIHQLYGDESILSLTLLNK